MVRKLVALMAGALLALGFIACKDKSDSQIPPHPIGGPGGGGGIVMPVGESEIVVPDSVKGAWTSVKLTIEDKASGKTNDAVIKLGSEYKVPNSDLKIQVGEFLPDFKMEGSVITSTSNELNNPAVRVTVLEGETEIHKGWLYSKFPAIHPFQHDKYGITLKEAVKKG